MEIREASTSAAALSSLLEAMAVNREGDFDGLILGAPFPMALSGDLRTVMGLLEP
jgi:hypothetical protein